MKGNKHRTVKNHHPNRDLSLGLGGLKAGHENCLKVRGTQSSVLNRYVCTTQTSQFGVLLKCKRRIVGYFSLNNFAKALTIKVDLVSVCTEDKSVRQ